MAIAFSNLGSSANPDINNSTNATSYSNTEWTPPSSGLIVLFVATREAAGLNGPPTVTGNSLTWTQIATYVWTDLTTNDWRVTLFAADASGSSTGVTTIDFGSDTQLACNASFFQVTGVDISGGVANAFVQTPTNSGNGTSGSITLAAASHADNRPISFFLHSLEEGVIPRANWTELDEFTGVGPIRGMNTQYRDDAFETTASASWITSDNWGGMAAELKASTGVTEIGHLYSAAFEEVSVSAIQDLFELNAPSNAVVVLHGLHITQSSDIGFEQLNVLIHRGATSGSGGSSITARPLEAGDGSFNGSVEANNTTQSTEGTILHSQCFSIQGGCDWDFLPECRPVISPSGRLIIELQTAPADALTMSGTIYFEEIGG
jgi:hypothetical protein